MAKYHINDLDEVKPCRAKHKCKFGGASGSEHHFASKQEAEMYVQRTIENRHGRISSLNRSKNQSELNSLHRSGVKIHKIAKIADYDFSSDSVAPTESTIDLLDEKPSPELLAKIQRGELAFGS